MKRVLILGSSHGLGWVLVKMFHRDGWLVTGVSRSGHREQLEGVDSVVWDLSVLSKLDEFVDSLPGYVDLVVSCLAVYQHEGSLEEQAIYSYKINALAPYLIVTKLLKSRSAEDSLATVMVNSDSIFHPNDKSPWYPSSKAALKHLTSSLAEQAKNTASYVSTMLMGPLDDERKVEQLNRVAAKNSANFEEIKKRFLEKSNPAILITDLIPCETVYSAIIMLFEMGHSANGALIRIDGGSAGALI
ncbi:SDR family NAD(P)-dependent oxidoreductase [Microcoleus sp. S28C3]|uniref:SDR family NAD(P)-dependent oxidoreductase n=1 Tax=Microcoleus sp. S28C3 TaxID=3055414 RepID=UPI002FD1862E